MGANVALLGATPLFVSGFVALLKGNVSGAPFCLVCCVRYDNNGEIGGATTAGKRPLAHPQGGAFLLGKRNTVLVAALIERRFFSSWR